MRDVERHREEYAKGYEYLRLGTANSTEGPADQDPPYI